MKTPYSRSESTTTSMAIVKDDTKSTILAHDDDNNLEEMADSGERSTNTQPESLSSPTTVAITSANAKFSGRFKAKSDHAKYDISFIVCLLFSFRFWVFPFLFFHWFLISAANFVYTKDFIALR